MIRKLVFALSLLGACFTGLVHALGLGEATVQSSLNQPLTAEIELVSVGGLGVDEILPGLATREEFLRAKVDRVYFLSDLRFEMVKNEKGNMVVVLTTTKPVREPFLNFIVEVIWPSGRLLREYALLIDPPLFSEEKASPVQMPLVSKSSATIAPADQANTGDRLSVAAPTKTSVSAVSAKNVNGGTYGATTASDTLWEIAVKARPNRSVTPQQVMLSIQDLNPKAFIKENINKLKAGQVLRLPTLEQIKERSSSQAIIEVISQNEALQPPRTRSVASVAKEVTPTTKEPTTSNADELKLVVASTQATTSNTANSGSSTQAGNGRAESNEEMMLALEKLDKASLENTELNGRVIDLEEQLQTLERILALKNDQLANIQGQMRANELAALNANEETAGQETVGQETSEQTVNEKSAVEQSDSVQASDLETVKVVENSETQTAEEAKKVVEPQSNTKIDEPVKAKTENLFDMVLNNPLYLGLLVIGIIVLVTVLWWVSRHNARKEEAYYAQDEDGDSELDAFDEDDNENVGFDDESDDIAEHESDQTDNEFEVANEESESDLDSSEKEGESEDVIAEADVYIAYGRLDQAANILENAISADPVRTDYRLKLLEVYKDSKDTEAFNRQFSELEAIQDLDAIEEATLIRTELLENELVSLEDKEQELTDSRKQEELESNEEQGAALETEEAALETEEIVNPDNSINFDSTEDVSEENLDVDFSSDELELDLDVDLDLAQEDELLAAEADDLEFESDDLALEAADLALEETKLELELGAKEEEEEKADITLLEGGETEIDVSSTPSADLLDIDLDDVDLSGALDQETEIELSDDLAAELNLSTETDSKQVDATVDMDEGISDEILDEAVEAFSGTDELADNLGDSDDFDFLDGTDEASTKLDLARAYIDMGDIDGAKDILAEVAKEGSAEQQTDANDLLASLGA